MNHKNIIYIGVAIFIVGFLAVAAFVTRGNGSPIGMTASSTPSDVARTTTEGLMSEEFPLPLTSEEIADIVMPSGPVTTTTAPSVPSNEVVPTVSSVAAERFVVGLKDTYEQITENLSDQGFIRDKSAFLADFARKSGVVAPGGYHLSKDMSEAKVAETLHAAPYMKWVVVPEGLRKEEIASILAEALGWSASVQQKWVTTYSRMKYDYIDGVYFPDTYLLPIGESPIDTTNRILAKFNEKFAPYLPQFAVQNVKWTTGLTLASIVQREAASSADMPLIAGILWNRLDRNMALCVDATLQYVRGDTGMGWWAPASAADKKLDSPYNTYLYKGLPPHPISNPGISAIEAVLSPEKTDCLYYLHDKDRITHCAATYDEHLDNIEKYLK